MTVYFASRPSQPELVKIGHTDDVDTRLQQIAASFPDGLVLRAVCEGGRDVESAFHSMFSDQRSEGEWFRSCVTLSGVLKRLAVDPSKAQTVFKKKAVAEKSHAASDHEIAYSILAKIMSATPSLSVSSSVEDAFQLLIALNPVWTRRRVRSIWEKASKRIDHFEVRDLTAIAEQIFNKGE